MCEVVWRVGFIYGILWKFIDNKLYEFREGDKINFCSSCVIWDNFWWEYRKVNVIKIFDVGKLVFLKYCIFFCLWGGLYYINLGILKESCKIYCVVNGKLIMFVRYKKIRK